MSKAKPVAVGKNKETNSGGTDSKLDTKYRKGDKVLCYEPDPKKQKVIYNATILEVEYQDISKTLDKEVFKQLNELTKRKQTIHPTFLIHFHNWGPKYDRWVAEDLILEESEENLEMKRLLDEEAQAKIKKRPRRSSSKQSSDKANTSAIPAPKYKLNITLPPTIKQSLERDFVNITLRNLIIKLPRSPTVETILAKFADHITTKTPPEDKVLAREFVTGITTYFDFILPLQLLYKDERSQYECEGIVHAGGRTKRQQLVLEKDGHNIIYPGYTEWGCSPDKPGPLQPSKVYGIEHLLRLFVKLPEFLDHMDVEQLKSLSYFSNMFLSYVAVHRAEVFVEIQPYTEHTRL